MFVAHTITIVLHGLFKLIKVIGGITDHVGSNLPQIMGNSFKFQVGWTLGLGLDGCYLFICWFVCGGVEGCVFIQVVRAKVEKIYLNEKP